MKLGKNSIANTVRLVGELDEKIAPPEGVELRDAAEVLIWHQFTSARARDGWREFDLIVLAKAVRLESDIRRYQMELDEEKTLTSTAKLLLKVIDTLQRQQLAVMRSLSLCQTRTDPRTLNGQGIEKARLRNAMNNVDDLLAH